MLGGEGENLPIARLHLGWGLNCGMAAIDTVQDSELANTIVKVQSWLVEQCDVVDLCIMHNWTTDAYYEALANMYGRR